jgi:serine protease AprX
MKMDEVQRLPIKIIIPQDSDHSAPLGGGGPARVFGEDIDQMRNVLAGQIGEVRECFSQTLCQPDGPPAVARVVLKKEALAKSHRPYDLFSQDTCPIIGGEGFGHMLVSVSAAGLDQLEEKVLRGPTTKLKANISTVEQIIPYTAADAVGSIGLDGLAGQLAEDKALALKLRLFQHADPEANASVHQAFLRLLELMELPQPEGIFCISDLLLYRVTGITPDTIESLAQFVGVQSLGLFSQFGLVAQYAPTGEVTEAILPPPNPDQHYPIVGIIDSGTDPENALLQAWVEDRDEDDVPPADQDNNHGSFVAGLIANGRG